MAQSNLEKQTRRQSELDKRAARAGWSGISEYLTAVRAGWVELPKFRDVPQAVERRAKRKAK